MKNKLISVEYLFDWVIFIRGRWAEALQKCQSTSRF